MSRSSSTAALDGVAAVRRYVERIVHGDGRLTSSEGEGGGGGMKVLLLDAATAPTVAAVYTQTEILNEGVYLVAALEQQPKQPQQLQQQPFGNNNNNSEESHNTTSHLKAVCFLRPTAASVDALCGELQRHPPRYGEYHVFFSGPLATGLLRRLADADAAGEQRVRQVQEFYADFLPLDPDLWTLSGGGCRHANLAMTVSAGTSWAPRHAAQYERHLQGLQAMLLALRRRPAAVRYAAASPCAEELARDLQDAVDQQPDLFHFRSSGSGGGGLLLLVLDRRDDPVTPLLSQWTYQAMVHELLGLNNHRVVLRGAPGVDAKDLEEVVLQDDFFRANRHKNFGELGEEVQRLLQDYQKQTAQVQHHITANLTSIQDMQQFLDKFPELRSRSHTVSKHVAILGELARLVQVCHLMDVSQFEQTLAYAYTSDDHSAHWRELLEKLHSPDIKVPDKLRLGLLYALRYEVTANLHMLQQAMGKGGVPPDLVQLLPVLLRYGGRQQRGPGLFGNYHTGGGGGGAGGNLVSRVTKNLVGAVQGVDNVYSQHVPLLMDTLQQAARGKLSFRDYPVVPGSAANGGGSRSLPHHHHPQQQQHQQQQEPPTEILVFMVGGVTYEEGTKVSEFNAQHKGRVQVVLAGSTVHNSTSFLDELKATAL